MATVTVCSDFGAQENKIHHCFHFFPSYLPLSDGTDLSVLNVEVLSQLFHSHFSPSRRGPLVPLHFLPLERYYLHVWGCWYFFHSLESSQVSVSPFGEMSVFFVHFLICLLLSYIFILDISPLSDIWPTKLSLALLAVFSLSWWYTLKWKFYIHTHTYICNQPIFSSIAVLYCILDKIIFIKLWVYSYTTELYLRFFYIFAYH